jgi:hypothetical protein
MKLRVRREKDFSENCYMARVQFLKNVKTEFSFN